MMIVYRITKTRYINDLTGTGARQYGGRWNHKGTGIIYASESRSLAILEYLVHVPLSILPSDLSIVSISIPDTINLNEIPAFSLPENWKIYPAPLKLADIGTNWAMSNESLLLRVPSVVVEHEFNILINPSHPDIKHVSILNAEKYLFDDRLIQKK